MIQHILGPLLWESSLGYLDDVAIMSRGTDHINDLASVFKRLRRWGVTVKLTKCTSNPGAPELG